MTLTGTLSFIISHLNPFFSSLMGLGFYAENRVSLEDVVNNSLLAKKTTAGKKTAPLGCHSLSCTRGSGCI